MQKRKFGVLNSVFWISLTTLILSLSFILKEFNSIIIFLIAFFGLLSFLKAIASVRSITVVTIGNGLVHFKKSNKLNHEIQLNDIQGMTAVFELVDVDGGKTIRENYLLLHLAEDDFCLTQNNVKSIVEIAVMLERHGIKKCELQTEFEPIRHKWDDYYSLFQERHQNLT